MNNFNSPKEFNIENFDINLKRILITSGGFEDRSLYWINNLPEQLYFDDVIICKYEPEKKSRYKELYPLVKERSQNEPVNIIFHRFFPYKFETRLKEKKDIHTFQEVVIDISVMSKLMIMIIFNNLKDYSGNIRLIYCEPTNYSPKEEEYNKNKESYNSLTNLPSVGVHDVVRTPGLSSVVMFRSPALLISFLSFNEQLIRALLTVLCPTNLILINGAPPVLKWREQAMQGIHKEIIKEYSNDNKIDSEGNLLNKSSTLYYNETFQMLAEFYKEYCYNRRIILAPTGSKMQAVACALLKICCPDIHIEYPTPESFFIKDYSSSDIRKIHEVYFQNFNELIKEVAENYQLNG